MEQTKRIPKSPHYQKNRDQFGDGVAPCVVCGRPCPKPKWFLECVGGGVDHCVLPGTADYTDGGYMGGQPIGTDCLKKHPDLLDFVIPNPDGN